MKCFGKILKLLAALAAIAGAVYVAITYGDKIVAWVKEKLNLGCCCCDCDCECDEDCDCECTCEEAADEVVEVPAESTPAADTVQAEESDFEG